MIALLGILLLVGCDSFSMQHVHRAWITAIISQQTNRIISTPAVEDMSDIVCVQHSGKDSGEIQILELKKLSQHDYAIAKISRSDMINIIAYKKNIFTIDPQRIHLDENENSISVCLKNNGSQEQFVIQSSMHQSPAGISNVIQINGIMNSIYTDSETIPVVTNLPLIP